MDANDLFNKLASGTKFNKKRFQSDARRFQVRYLLVFNNITLLVSEYLCFFTYCCLFYRLKTNSMIQKLT